MASIRSLLSTWSASTLSDTYPEAKRESADFIQYKKTLKRTWVGQKADLAGMLGNIATKLRTYEMKAYTPPDGLRVAVCTALYFIDGDYRNSMCYQQDLDKCWEELLSGEAERSRAVNANIRQ